MLSVCICLYTGVHVCHCVLISAFSTFFSFLNSWLLLHIASSNRNASLSIFWTPSHCKFTAGWWNTTKILAHCNEGYVYSRNVCMYI